MEFLIPDVQNIIYKYVHEMNMFDILYEMTCFLDDHCERLCFELEKNILLGLYDCVNTSYCINTPALSSNQKKLKDLIKSEKLDQSMIDRSMEDAEMMAELRYEAPINQYR